MESRFGKALSIVQSSKVLVANSKLQKVYGIMIEIYDLEGVQERCPPKEDQHKKVFYLE